MSIVSNYLLLVVMLLHQISPLQAYFQGGGKSSLATSKVLPPVQTRTLLRLISVTSPSPIWYSTPLFLYLHVFSPATGWLSVILLR